MESWLAKLRGFLGKWPEEARGYFVSVWGLDPTFAVRAALLYAALWFAGLNPRITSGHRPRARQAALRARWDAGDREGLVVRPADPARSWHCQEGPGGEPRSRAIDMPCDDNELAARIGRALGLRAGFFFRVRDPGHFDNGGL